MTTIYLVATPAAEQFRSYMRDPQNPSRMLAYTSARDAAFAEAHCAGFIPGFFIGGNSPHMLSSLDVDELKCAVQNGPFTSYFKAYGGSWEGQAEIHLEESHEKFWFDRLKPEHARRFFELFDRWACSEFTGKQHVVRVELED